MAETCHWLLLFIVTNEPQTLRTQWFPSRFSPIT